MHSAAPASLSGDQSAAPQAGQNRRSPLHLQWGQLLVIVADSDSGRWLRHAPSPSGRGLGEGRLLSGGAWALTLTLSLGERGSEGAGVREDQAKSVIVTKPVVWNVVIESTTSGTWSIEMVSVTMVSGTSLPDATMFNIAG